MNEARKQPNLFIVGAPKCGTTSLASWLGSHPEIFLPAVKEPHHYNVDEQQVYYRSRSDYLNLYSAGRNCKYRLDASVWYLHSEEAVPRILKDQPNAKFIVCLRNPVDMAFSLHSQYLNKTHRETISNFRKAWDASDKRLSGRAVPHFASDPRYLAYKYSCRVGSQTERLMNTASPTQVKALVLDDLISQPERVLADLLHFLRLEARIPLNFPSKNPSVQRKHPSLSRYLRYLSQVRKRLGVTPAARLGLGSGSRWVRKWASAEKPVDQLSHADRQVVTEYFLEEIWKIWSLVGARYESWIDSLGPDKIDDSLH